MTSNGYSPLNVTGLDPGIMYSVTINMFDGNQVVLSDQAIMRSITVMSDQSGIFMYIHTYVHSYVHAYIATYVCTYVHMYMVYL